MVPTLDAATGDAVSLNEDAAALKPSGVVIAAAGAGSDRHGWERGPSSPLLGEDSLLAMTLLPSARGIARASASKEQVDMDDPFGKAGAASVNPGFDEAEWQAWSRRWCSVRCGDG